MSKQLLPPDDKKPIKPTPIKGMPGLFYGKATIYDHRGPCAPEAAK